MSYSEYVEYFLKISLKLPYGLLPMFLVDRRISNLCLKHPISRFVPVHAHLGEGVSALLLEAITKAKMAFVMLC